ncbi:MAG: 16S rRNA (guanine(966)-N(2))-methyltransferase RsmD [Gammaproteobacteria bacterium]
MRANQQPNQLRIIAGAWRGRKLVFAPVAGLRPTADRVRETLFNWLGLSVHGARCLDLFAGSGALGLEAASRGAAAVVLVDADPLVVRTLQEQVRVLDARQARIVQANCERYLLGPAEPFDLVFLDPPYRQGALPGCMELLEQRGWLASDAWIYLEAERELEFSLPGSWEPYRSKLTGQVGSHLVRRSTVRGQPHRP